MICSNVRQISLYIRITIIFILLPSLLHYPKWSVTAQERTEISTVCADVTLYKRDAITGESIQDALIQILQYNSNTEAFQYYADMSYNSQKNCYESGTLYYSTSNSGRFKLQEIYPGQNYLPDWEEHEIQLAEEFSCYELDMETMPVLGVLQLYKGVTFPRSYLKEHRSTQTLNGNISLYAAKDIYLKDNIFYPADEKLVDIIIWENGRAEVKSLLPGKYYLKKTEYDGIHKKESKKYYFSISRDKKGRYSTIVCNYSDIK